MERGLPRASLSGSALVECLARWALLDGPAVKPSFVEGMGRWLGWTDAIALSAALPLPMPASAGEDSASTAPTHFVAAPAEREFARVRAALVRAITDPGDTAVDRRRPAAQPPAAAVTDETDFLPHRRHYTALQQAMQAAITPLRAQAREAVARRSPELSRLAAIDAVMDSVLGAREQALLATMPSLLHKHFERLRQSHKVPALASGEGGAPDGTARPGPWLAVFRQDMQRLLLAELDLRLQPVQGLLEAAAQQTTRDP